MRYFKRIDRDMMYIPEDSVNMVEFTDSGWRIKLKDYSIMFVEPKFYDNPFHGVSSEE